MTESELPPLFHVCLFVRVVFSLYCEPVWPSGEALGW